jgi:hypothetical protein
LLAYEYYVAGLELNFFGYSNEGAVAAAFINQDKATTALHDPGVLARHIAIVGEGYVAARAAYDGFFFQLVDLARLPAFAY